MSLLLARGTQPEGTEVKTFSADQVMFGKFLNPTIVMSIEDFCETVIYVMTNTELVPNDPRLKLIEEIKALKKVEGFSKGQERLE